MNKNLLLLPVLALGMAACGALQDIKGMHASAVNCRYELAGAEVEEASFTTVTMGVAVAVTNQSKTAPASMNRFEGNLLINGNEVSQISFGSYDVAPGATELIKTKLDIPFTKIGKNIAGLVAANSISLDYKIVGKIYFDTPIGEVPFPVVIQKQEKK